MYERARAVLAGGRTHDSRTLEPFPVYFERAEGPMKWDAEGRAYVDYWMGHGALLLGHRFPPVVDAVARQLSLGTHFGGPHRSEVEWAEWVCRLVPSAERVRFTSSGTEGTLLAVRVARALTGRPRVVRFDGHFHGWHDEAIARFVPAGPGGINPAAEEGVAVADPFDVESAVEELEAGDVAAVLLEPGGGSSGSLRWGPDALRRLRAATTEHGALLVFDEVITGFRAAPGGVQEVTGVIPDITVLGKILAGGLPGGAVAGRAEVMSVFDSAGTNLDGREARVLHTGTFNANPLSAAAGVAMLEAAADGAAQAEAAQAAERLVAGVNEAALAAGVDVRLFASGSIYHVLVGGIEAGAEGISPAAGVVLPGRFAARYQVLRRALLLEGVDGHPVHGWLSARHDREVVDASVAAFGRAFAALADEPGFSGAEAPRPTRA